MKPVLTVLALLLLPTAASAQTFSVFYTFDFTDGSSPNGGLILDSEGNPSTVRPNLEDPPTPVVFKLNPQDNSLFSTALPAKMTVEFPLARYLPIPKETLWNYFLGR